MNLTENGLKTDRGVTLSVLDLATVGVSRTSAQALADSTALARAAEAAGYHRFWVAEHHNMPAVASTNPPVLLAHLAAHTSTLHVGSGGVMLPNHAPLVVAEQFALLEALYPGRIDLGIGRAPGTDPRTASALRRSVDGLSVEEFPTQVLQTMAMLGDVREELSASGARLALSATPNPETFPSVWLLGSSGYSAQLAGMLGLPYSYAHHFAPHVDAAVSLYRENFRPSRVLAEPYFMLTTSALAADTAQNAEFLAGPAKVQALSLRTGNLGPIVTPESAAARSFSEQENSALESAPAIRFVGDQETVTRGLRELVQRTGADELMIAGATYDVSDRIASLNLIAQNW